MNKQYEKGLNQVLELMNKGVDSDFAIEIAIKYLDIKYPSDFRGYVMTNPAFMMCQ